MKWCQEKLDGLYVVTLSSTFSLGLFAIVFSVSNSESFTVID